MEPRTTLAGPLMPAALLASLSLIGGSGGCESRQALTVSLPVVADGSGLTESTTDLGYRIRVSQLRLALRDLHFTIRGEMHARRAGGERKGGVPRLGRLLVKEALAHPGHYAGGEVTGELPGSFLIDFTSGEKALGMARLLTGQYQGANFTFRRAGPADGLAAADPLHGHTAYLEGRAEKEGKAVRFTAQVDVDEGTQMVGAPFELNVEEGSKATLMLQVLATNPFKKERTLLQGIDFFALDGDGDGEAAIQPGSEAHNILRRTVQVHDYYFIKHR